MSEITVRRTTVDVDFGTVKDYAWWPEVGDRFTLDDGEYTVTSNDPMFATSSLARDRDAQRRQVTWERLAQIAAARTEGGR